MTSAALRKRATGVAEDLVSKFPQVTGVCLYGSVARGDAGPESDVDLFVLGDDPQLTPSSIRRKLGLHTASPRVSIVYHTPDTLERYLQTKSRFLLHLQLEGEVLYDTAGQLTELQGQAPISGSIRAEVDGQLKRLSLYRDPLRYNGNFLFPLSHIYAIGKAIVMAILAENEIYVFNRDRAFDAFVSRFPSTASDIATLRELGPFYSLVSRDAAGELPFSYHDCEKEVAEAIAAVKRLAKRARSA